MPPPKQPGHVPKPPRPPRPPKPKVAAPAALIGGDPLHPPDPITKAVAEAKKPPTVAQRRARTILRRQRLLRALGLYKGQIDGLWGPHSQKAWAIYVDRRRKGRRLDAPFLEPQQLVARERKEARQSHVALIRSQARKTRAVTRPVVVDIQKTGRTQTKPAPPRPQGDNIGRDQKTLKVAAQHEAKVRFEREAKKVAATAHQLRTAPATAAKVPLHELAAVIADPATKFDPTSKADALFVQTWLASHGHPVVKTGKWDKATNDALSAAYTQAARAERAQAVNLVVKNFYDGAYVPGMRPSWWTDPGPVPKPGELLDKLQRGGFEADKLIRQIVSNSDRPHAEFAVWRQQQLDTVVKKLRGIWDAPLFVQKSGGAIMETGNLLLAIQRTLPPKQAAELQAQVSTLWGSRTGDEFARKVVGAVKTADRAYTVAQAEKAKKPVTFWGRFKQGLHPEWWGEMATRAIYPIEQAERGISFTKTAIVADIYMGLDLAIDGKLREDRSVYWDEAQKARHNAPLALRLGDEFIADPLLFVRPFRIASTGVRYGNRLIVGGDTLGLGGYKLASQGGKWAVMSKSAVTYEKATWHLPIKTATGTALRSIPGVDKALRMKTVAVDHAQNTVIQASRHAFDPPRKAFAQLGAHTAIGRRLSPQARKMVVESRDELVKLIPIHMKQVYDAYKAAGASVYVDAHRKTLSSLGAALTARWAEEIRVQETFRIANKYAGDVYERAFNGGFLDAERDALLSKHKLTFVYDYSVQKEPVGVERLPGARPDAMQRYNDDLAKLRTAEGVDRNTAMHRAYLEYQRVRQAAGLFIQGSGDPEIVALVNRRVAHLSEQFQEVLLPRLQDALEEGFEAEGRELWDEGGLWLGRHGDAAKELSAFSREAFDAKNLVAIDNPLYAQEMTFAEALPILEGEVRRAHARLHAHAERAAAAGKPYPESWLPTRLAEERARIERSFVEGNFTPRVVVNDEAVRALLKELDVPLDTPVEVIWKKGSEFYGRFFPDAKVVEIHADPDVLKYATAEAGKESFVEATYHATVAHEVRHAFQERHWDKGFLADDLERPYADRAIELDANAFEKTRENDINRLVTIVKPRGGKFMDTRRKLFVPSIYARGHEETFEQWGKRFNGGRRIPRFEASALSAGDVPITAKTAIDNEIGSTVWSLGSFHADDTVREFEDVGPIRRFSVQGEREQVEAKIEFEQRFRRAVQHHHIALAQGMDQTLPHALKENYALMQALAHAQTTPFRVLYKALDGALNTWIFATLPLRSGWVVRNVVDNAAKVFIAGARDPRAYFRPFEGGRIATAAVSIFEAEMGGLIEATRFLDKLFGTNAAVHLETALNTFWQHSLDVLRNVFHTHGWNIPDEVLEGARLNPFERPTGGPRITRTGLFDPGEVESLAPEFADAARKHVLNPDLGPSRYQSFRDNVWKVMANKPENYYKRVLYNDTMDKLKREGVSTLDAHAAAWAKVEETLFDYSKISVVEDNLRLFFPFIQFWRKNTGLWARNFATKPWLTVQMNNYMEYRDQAHEDWPPWMRRYVNVQEITDATAVVPGLGWLAETTGVSDMQFDPLSFASFGPYLRAFKSQNENLPSDQQGMAIFGPMIDALNDWGLGLSPFFRKPAESAHIASVRSWQTIFPQTAIASAITRKFFGDTAAGHVRDWERIFTLMQGDTPSDALAQDFEFYVRRSMENQIARGEPVNRQAAEAEVRTQFLAQNLYGYFVGIYFRRNTPQDFYTAKLQNDVMTGEKDFDQLSDDDKTLLSVWSKTGIDHGTGKFRIDRLTFDRYTEAIPMIQAYYQQGSWKAGQAFLHQHPEIVEFVDPLFSKGRIYSANYVRSAAMYLKGKEFFDVDALMTDLDLPYETRKIASTLLVTPKLQEYWAKNDTPAETRNKMVKAEMHGYLNELSATYFAIPETDHAARDAFLVEHPELERFWQHNNSRSDDFKAIQQTALSDLRELYFGTLKEHGFDGAAPVLQQYPFMFHGTSAEDRVDETRGIWIPGGRHSLRGQAYLAAYSSISHFGDLMDSGHKEEAFDFLRTAEGKLAQDYFDKYGKNHNTPRARAARKARPAIQHFADLMDAGKKKQAFEYLRTAEGKLAQDYFDRYGKNRNKPRQKAFRKARAAIQHFSDLMDAGREQEAFNFLRTPEGKLAQDYFDQYGKNRNKPKTKAAREARKGLQRFADLMDAGHKQAAFDYLDSDDPDARLARAYFDRYGKNHNSKRARAFREARWALKHYFHLRDEVSKAAAYSWLDSDTPGAKLVREYFKKWSKKGSYHAQDYLRAQKWLKLYWRMPKDVRATWLKGDSPGAKVVRAYFAKWADDSKGMTAHAQAYLEAKSGLDHYFSLDKDARKKWLEGGSKDAAIVLDYFKRFSSTAKLEKAFRKANPDLATTDPELRRRIAFWRDYFMLTPDLRPQFVHDNAEEAGVFVFGALGDGEAHDREQKYIRAAMSATIKVDGKPVHLSEKQATFMYVRPLLDQLYAIPKKERGLFIAANPELADYLDTFSKASPTGDKAMDAKLERYFRLPQGSVLRTSFLEQNPDVQDYFDAHSTESQRAMHSLLEVYFKLYGRDRVEFGQKHPEIQVYFSRRRDEKAALAEQMSAFEQADPRLSPFFDAATADIEGSAERMRAVLREAHFNRYRPDGIATRRDRAPA